MNEDNKEDVKNNEQEINETQETEDVSFEEVNEDGEMDVKATISKLRQKIKKLEAEKQEYLLLSQRTRADYINFKKEVEGSKVSDRKYATRKFIEELIPVLDAYDGARGNKEAWENVDQNWRIGVEYIFGQLLSVIEKEGVKRFGKEGDVFDPMLHETMETVLVENREGNDVLVKVLQSGYMLHDTVIRPARVHVGIFKESE